MKKLKIIMNKIKIYFNYKHIETAWGGANNFIRYLYRKIISEEDLEIVSDINSEYDILFLNTLSRGPGRQSFKKFISLREVKNIKKYGWTSLFRYLLHRRKCNKKIIIRAVNLIKHTYNRYNKRDGIILFILNNLADYVIFQSQYIYKVFKSYGYKGDRYSIIHNGTDQTIFNLKNKKLWNGKEKLRVVSSSFSPRETKNHCVIADFSIIDGLECIHIGNWPKNVDRKNVVLLGILNHKNISDIFKDSHVFLHPGIKEACCNVLFEAISSGLPVVYNPNEGSSAEIVKNCGMSIQTSPEETIKFVKNKYNELCKNIIDNYHYYSIDRSALKYIEIFRRVNQDMK